MTTPAARIEPQNDKPFRPSGEFVLYWMSAARRTRYNFALQRAVELANEFGKPLVILEALRVDHPFASDRFHAFVLEGMHANARAARRSAALYYPYVEALPRAGAGLIESLGARAAAVITDWFPAFFLPRMLAAAAARCPVRMESVDSNGLIPVAAHERAFPTARGYRAFVQRTLRTHLADFPLEDPLATLTTKRAALPAEFTGRWPIADLRTAVSRTIAALPIDHAVPAVEAKGGTDAAGRALQSFLTQKLPRYADEGNDPDADCTSRLSPYLHFGHISAHEVFSTLMTGERWTTRRLAKVRAGAREGWWGTSQAAAQFLDQLVVWRELAFNGCARTLNFEAYETLPDWARKTLEQHLPDDRPHLYTIDTLEAAETYDEVWNAAQRELRRDGWCHGYLRMLWGKKILEWCRHPAEALQRMEYLMNKYSLDGRDPVSYLNYGWVLGRYDRPWPERPVFGTVRCMTSESAKRKLRMKQYLAKFGS